MTEFPDPRPRVVPSDAGPCIDGWRCTECRRPIALDGPWCPYCRGTLEAATFGPAGIVWSATVLRVALPERPPPSGLVYVDLDDGPRVLGHVAGPIDQRLRVGTRVRAVSVSEAGDLQFEEAMT